MSANASFQTTRFLTLARDERVSAEYFVRRSDRRIFTGAMLAAMLVAGYLGFVGYNAIVAAAERDAARTRAARESTLKNELLSLESSRDTMTPEWYDERHRSIQAQLRDVRTDEVPAGLGFLALVPPALVFLYFLFRHRPSAMGYLVLTNRRVIYYEYDEHPRQNYRYVAEARLAEVTGIYLGMGRSFLRKHMHLCVTTKKYAPIWISAVGGVSFAADLLRTDTSPSTCVPAEDALQCVQELGGRVRALQAGMSSAVVPSTRASSYASAVPTVVRSAPSMTCETCGMDIVVSGPRPASCPHCGSAT